MPSEVRRAVPTVMSQISIKNLILSSVMMLAVASLELSCTSESWEETLAAGQRALQQRHYGEAERQFRVAVEKAEAFGREDRRIAVSLSQLAEVYAAQRRYLEAEPIYGRALSIYQVVHGEDHPDVAAMLNNLGVVHRLHGQFSEAEPLLKRALAIKEKVYGPDHAEVAVTLGNLGQLYLAQGRFKDAEPYYRRALSVREKVLGDMHPDVAKSLEDYAVLLRTMGREKEALPLESRAQGIRVKGASPPRPAKSSD